MHPEFPDEKNLTDVELFHALTARDSSALTTLYDRYAKLVYGLALKILKDTHAAEDLTQEVFLTLWRHPTYNPARGTFSSFLITLTRSRGIDKLRSRHANLKVLDRWSQHMPTQIPNNNPFEQASLEERSQKIRSALSELPENQRQVLAMAYYEGLTQTEIAQRLDTPLGTIKTRARQGLIKLKTILQDWIN